MHELHGRRSKLPLQKTRQTSGLAGGSAAKMRRHSYPNRRSGIGTGWRCWFLLVWDWLC